MSQEIFVSDDGKIKLLNGREEGMRLVNSQTRQIVTQQPAIEYSSQRMRTQEEAQILQTQQLPPPRIQSQQVLRQNISIPQVSYPGTYSVQQNCQQAPPLCMNIVVVSKEEIETPWRLECEYLQSIIADLERRKEAKVVEKEVVKVVTDNTRIEQLEAQLLQLRRENDQLKNQMMQMRNSYEQQLDSLRGDVNLHSANAADSASLQAEFYAMRTQLEDQIAGLRRQISDLEIQLSQSQQENDRLKQLLSNRDAEIQQLRLQISKLQTNAQDTSQLRDLENQLRQSKDENSRLERLLQQANQDIQNWKNKCALIEQESYTKNNELIMQIRDYENKLALISTDIERLQIQIRNKDAELNEWRMRYTELESQGTTVIQEKVTYLSQEVEVWKSKFIKTNHEYNKCQEELTMCQAELESLRKSGSKREVVVTQRTVTSRAGNTLTVTGPTGSQSQIKRTGHQE
ncbi:unnamed protein product (macronuclear) [Paramecium tetraurelia]|uniref:Uncharacterized protein n=1 Tax=Paramecium tetraurelia TaxID=5888 RepID=A0CPW0_PARTE|nr:uncharacterized protein GSPATT00009219001 [Paramecium tetraurelia]CAK72827.1 unnamed protein product [Paramecium tetraurelia]|eukprot:XP_001440224.1 hypothetical protein (macronuclear) [Paramecium tetraurelia strain d4-2]